MRYLSVCSGMEAASVAWEPLGFKAVGFSEIEPFPCAILKHRFPNTPNYGSLTEYQSWPIEQGTVDLLVGGTPCQSFSVAGLRKGLEDPRGNLALTFLGLADKLRPKWIVWENVPGVLSSNGGRDLGSFLGALGQLGYGWAFRILDAQHFGVPQRRRRVFVVATSTGDGRLAGEVLSLPEGLRGYLETRKQKRKGAAADAGASAEADGLQRTVGTLCADTHPGAYSGQDAYTGRLIPDEKPIVIDRAAFNQGENAQYEPHIEESDVMDSLIARGPHAIGQPIPIQDGREIEKRQNGLGIGQPGDPAYTIDTTGAQAAGVVAIQGTIIGRGENAGPQGVGATEGGPMFTLTKTDIHGVAVPFRKAKRAQSTTDDESWVEGEVSNTLNNFDLGDTRTTHAVVEPTPAPLMFKVRGGVEANDGSQGGEPGKVAGKGFLGSKDKAFTLAATQDQWLAHPIISPTVTTCKGSRGGCSSEAIDEITAIHQAQQVDPKIIQASELRLQGKITEQDVCPTLKANTKSGDTEPLALQPITFQPGNLRREAGADPSTEATTTLKASPGDQMPHVAYPMAASFKSGQGSASRSIGWDENVSPTLPANAGGNTAPAVVGTMTAMAVRRLTPVECERLQGFPDNWSRIPWKGKPEEECPDGPRYKACGNSMAVPVMRWIGKQIALVEKRIADNNR